MNGVHSGSHVRDHVIPACLLISSLSTAWNTPPFSVSRTKSWLKKQGCNELFPSPAQTLASALLFGLGLTWLWAHATSHAPACQILLIWGACLALTCPPLEFQPNNRARKPAARPPQDRALCRYGASSDILQPGSSL